MKFVIIIYIFTYFSSNGKFTKTDFKKLFCKRIVLFFFFANNEIYLWNKFPNQIKKKKTAIA